MKKLFNIQLLLHKRMPNFPYNNFLNFSLNEFSMKKLFNIQLLLLWGLKHLRNQLGAPFTHQELFNLTKSATKGTVVLGDLKMTNKQNKLPSFMDRLTSKLS